MPLNAISYATRLFEHARLTQSTSWGKDNKQGFFPAECVQLEKQSRRSRSLSAPPPPGIQTPHPSGKQNTSPPGPVSIIKSVDQLPTVSETNGGTPLTNPPTLESGQAPVAIPFIVPTNNSDDDSVLVLAHDRNVKGATLREKPASLDKLHIDESILHDDHIIPEQRPDNQSTQVQEPEKPSCPIQHLKALLHQEKEARQKDLESHEKQMRYVGQEFKKLLTIAQGELVACIEHVGAVAVAELEKAKASLEAEKADHEGPRQKLLEATAALCDATKLDYAQTGFRSYTTLYRHRHPGPATTTHPSISMGSLSRLTDMNGDAQTDLADCGTIAGDPTTQQNASSFASIRVKGGHHPSAPPIQPHNRHDRTNEQINTKSQHRVRCQQELRDGREQRVRKIRERCLENDGVEIDWGHCAAGDEGLQKIDRENGLVALEPTDFKFEEMTRKKMGGSSLLGPSGDVNTSSRKQADPRKLRMLLHKLSEVSPLHPKTTTTIKLSPPAPAHTQGTKGASQLTLSDIPATVLDTPLSVEALANIFTAHAVLDLGKVTVHSMNVIPLNFLNATPGNNPIHITISEEGGRYGGVGAPSEAINVTPKHTIVPQMSIAGFTVQVCLHTPGLVERQITYLVNGRYKYLVPVCVEVVPVSLDLAETESRTSNPCNEARTAQAAEAPTCT
ncbi:hypothetical protein DFS34DRAFT_619208 [Phlyctochytrium arcticum]|nr:hypothetical protein DFS34DRAFT_619208 [Phlyctochytrium arcticum]